MKITEMIYRTVLAFDPKRHPWFALAALAMLLTAFVALCYFGGVGAGALIKALL